MKRLGYYFKIWLMMNRNSFMVVLSQKLIFVIFLFGKLLRFTFFIGFIYFLLKGINHLAGYSVNQTIFFFLTFNLIDIASQFLFREVYRFRPLIISGDFDLVLVKPQNALFRVLMGGADVIDLVTIPPLIFVIFYIGRLLHPDSLLIAYYLLLVMNGLLIATAFHIAVISLGIITLEIDHTIMIYRDLTNLGRFPVDIYREPLRGILTFFVPIGIMITLPAKAFMGLVTPMGVTGSFILGFLSIFLAIKFWDFALKRYSSASS